MFPLSRYKFAVRLGLQPWIRSTSWPRHSPGRSTRSAPPSRASGTCRITLSSLPPFGDPACLTLSPRAGSARRASTGPTASLYRHGVVQTSLSRPSRSCHEVPAKCGYEPNAILRWQHVCRWVGSRAQRVGGAPCGEPGVVRRVCGERGRRPRCAPVRACAGPPTRAFEPAAV
jgi:hypothetical protein